MREGGIDGSSGGQGLSWVWKGEVVLLWRDRFPDLEWRGAMLSILLFCFADYANQIGLLGTKSLCVLEVDRRVCITALATRHCHAGIGVKRFPSA